MLKETQKSVGTMPVQTLRLGEHLQQSPHHSCFYRHSTAGQGASADVGQPLGHQQLVLPLTHEVGQPLQEQQQGLVVTDTKAISVDVLPLNSLRDKVEIR